MGLFSKSSSESGSAEQARRCPSCNGRGTVTRREMTSDPAFGSPKWEDIDIRCGTCNGMGDVPA